MRKARSLATSPVSAQPSGIPDRPNLFVTELGPSGKNVLLLHGWGCDSNDWMWQLPAFESRYRTVCVDLRGHGRSELATSGSYRPEDFVSDIERLIVDQYAGAPFVVVGHSMGGQIAARLASRRADLVSGLVLVDATLGFDPADEARYQRFCDRLDAEDPRKVTAELFKSLNSPLSDPAVIRWHARRLQGMHPQVLRAPVRPMLLGLDQVAMGPASESLCRSIKCPALVMHSAKARVDTVRAWFENGRSEVQLWEGAGHWIHIDCAREFNFAATSWIDGL